MYIRSSISSDVNFNWLHNLIRTKPTVLKVLLPLPTTCARPHAYSPPVSSSHLASLRPSVCHLPQIPRAGGDKGWLGPEASIIMTGNVPLEKEIKLYVTLFFRMKTEIIANYWSSGVLEVIVHCLWRYPQHLNRNDYTEMLPDNNLRPLHIITPAAPSSSLHSQRPMQAKSPQSLGFMYFTRSATLPMAASNLCLKATLPSHYPPNCAVFHGICTFCTFCQHLIWQVWSLLLFSVSQPHLTGR